MEQDEHFYAEKGYGFKLTKSEIKKRQKENRVEAAALIDAKFQRIRETEQKNIRDRLAKSETLELFENRPELVPITFEQVTDGKLKKILK